MNIYKKFSSYETFTKSILGISILIVVLLVFFNNDYFKIIAIEKEIPQNNIPKTNKIPQNNIPEIKEIPQNNIPEANENSQNNIPEAKEILQNNIPEAKEIPQNNIPEANKISQNIIPEVKEIPDSIAIIISKIISDENLASTQISFNSYETQEWNSYSLGCPVNGETYALSIIKGWKISVDIDDKENIIHTSQNLKYVNCTKINEENSNADYNFHRKYNLENTKQITLILNSSEKILNTIEDPEKVTQLTNSLDKEINVKKVDYCDSIYTLIFSSESKEINFRVACEGNLNYVETEESLEITNLFIKILEDLLSTLEFPGMPSNE